MEAVVPTRVSESEGVWVDKVHLTMGIPEGNREEEDKNSCSPRCCLGPCATSFHML